MAEIPRAALDFLTEQVNAISVDAQAKVFEVLEAIEWTSDNVARCREIVTEALASVLPAYADAAAQASADFYDACRELCAGEAMGAAALSGLDMAAVQGAVRALVQVVVDGGAKERFNRGVLGRVDVEMKKAAANSIVENAAKDPATPRWARVPNGRETCPFCLMLASFGFNTGSKEAASHTHANCDCRIVPQWGDGSVEGYDPDGMYARYNACLDAIGGRDGVRREWDALPKHERDAYIAKHGGKAGKAFDAFLNKRASAEIERRDPEWFRTGKAPEVSFSTHQVKKRASEAERRTASRLAMHGIKPTFIQDYEWVVGEDGRKRKVGLPDLEIGIEIKTLGSSGNAFGAMDNYLENSAKKKGLRCVVVDNSESARIEDDDLVKAARKVVDSYPSIPHLRLLLKNGVFLSVK